MAEVFGAGLAVHLSPKYLGLNAGFSGLFSDSPWLDFGTAFEQFGTEFQDCFRIVRTEFMDCFRTIWS